MSRSLRVLSFILFISFLFSCQKETSFELGQQSKGSLQSSNGDCFPKTLHGNFTAGQALTDSNYIDITVTVTQTGTYTISTDTLNGYYFRGTGSFSALGSASVRLKGFGTPAAAGINDFTVSFDNTSCNIQVTVLPASSGGGTGVYTLQGNPGACMNSNVAGTYTQNTALTSANKVTIDVNVTTIGTWSINTATVSGFSFSGTGSFTTTGVQTITLNGTGTPTATGPQTFMVSAGASSCTFVVTVVPNTTPPAVFTLQGNPGACMNSSVAGTYNQGTALNASNTVTAQVNVTTVGQWTASTGTVTGMSFSGTGTFTATGIQNIVLTGSGTPAATGIQTFTLTAGSSSCTFSITVSGTTVSGDHFILTNNSWWSYSTPLGATDSLKRTILGPATISGVSYQTMKELNVGGQIDDSLYFRKSGNNYYNVNYVDYYTSFYLDGVIIDSILVVKEGLTTGATWSSPEYSDAVNGVPTKVKYVFTCTNANATVTLNSRTYSNVYQITMLAQVSTNGGPYTTDVTWINYYAQGIGWIYQKYDDGTTNYDLPIRYYQVF